MGVAEKMADDNAIKSCPCPICKTKSKILKGNNKRRYFCQECYIEFTTNGRNKVEEVFEIDSNGDLDKIEDWEWFAK